VKLSISTKCCLIETGGLDQETVDEFVNEYRNGTSRVLRVPDTDITRQHYVTRDAAFHVETGPDDVAPEPVAATDEGADAVAAQASGESGKS
jgi:hypothetical protein